MRVHLVTWILRAAWLTLPFTVGEVLGDAVAGRSDAVATTLVALAWIGWAVVLVAAAIPRAITLTIVRTGVPAAVPLAAWALADVDDGATVPGLVGLTVSLLAAVLSVGADVADDFVDGDSYGDERRFSLRAPGPVLVGPLPVAWLAVVGGLVAGPLLLAASGGDRGLVAVGVAATVVGWGSALLGARSLHTLSTRVVVLVPAGLTLVDPLALAESVLFPRARTLRLAPALVDTPALDLSQRALGLALQVDLGEPVALVVRDGRRSATEVGATSVVFTPARPARLLRAAAERRIPVGERAAVQRTIPPPSTTSPS